MYIVAPGGWAAPHPSARFTRTRPVGASESDRMSSLRGGTDCVRNQRDPDAASMCCILAPRIAHNTRHAINFLPSQLQMRYFACPRALRERAAGSAANTAGNPNHNEKGRL